MKVSDLNTNEYASYYSTYINRAAELELLEGLKRSGENTLAFIKTIPTDKHEYAYATDKWTIKELILHLIDTERVFVYRALRFARKDKTPLPGFDEGYYAANSNANEYSINTLLKTYGALRQSTLDLFENFTESMLLETGDASGTNMSVRALGFVIIGHEKHHCAVISERYL